MRTLLAYQPKLLDLDKTISLERTRYNGRSGTFVDNTSLPVHRWFRYSAGFSADWVRSLVQQQRLKNTNLTVLDPFSGVGTTLLACDAEQVQSIGFETHPFIYRIANAKLRSLHVDLDELRDVFRAFLDRVESSSPIAVDKVPQLLTKCYTKESLAALFSMKNIYISQFDDRTPCTELIWLTITSILRTCSTAGTAQWQYILPNKTKAFVRNPVPAFESKAIEILQDIEYAQHNQWANRSRIMITDARRPENCSDIKIDFVITSPPYPNNYDYADATRLEMTFWGEINGWGDLQKSVRQHLIRSCSQHAAAEHLVLDELLSASVLEPIRKPLSDACQTLAEVRQTKGGRKCYHTMAAAYFRDLGLVFHSLRPLCTSGSVVCFVIGDSAPYGVYLSVDEWLGELALAAGFKSYSFEKIRDRNIKWENRKHRVPLKEGRLWIEG